MSKTPLITLTHLIRQVLLNLQIFILYYCNYDSYINVPHTRYMSTNPIHTDVMKHKTVHKVILNLNRIDLASIITSQYFGLIF